MPSPNDMAYVMMVIYEFEGRLCSNAVLYVCRYIGRVVGLPARTLSLTQAIKAFRAEMRGSRRRWPP